MITTFLKLPHKIFFKNILFHIIFLFSSPNPLATLQGPPPRNGYNIPLFPQKCKRFQNFFQLFLRSQVIVMQSVMGDGEKILRNLKKKFADNEKKRVPGLGFYTLSGR